MSTPIMAKNTTLLVDTHPAIAAEWHPTRNGDNAYPSKIATKSGQKVWWVCSVDGCGKEWEAFVFARIKSGSHGCHACRIKLNPLKYFHKTRSGITLADRCPALVPEWHEKNAPITPDVVGIGSRTFWWRCSRPGCTTEWQATASNRVKHGPGCPPCKRKECYARVAPEDSLEARFPEIAAEWNHAKNDTLTPATVHHGKKLSVWWLCADGHEFKNHIHNRTRLGNGCPVCKNTDRARGLTAEETKPEVKERPRKHLPRTEQEYEEKRKTNMERRSANAIEIGGLAKSWVMDLCREQGMEIVPLGESCKADFLWVTGNEDGQPVGYPVKVKASSHPRTFIFMRCDKYLGHVLVCVGTGENDTRRLWVFHGAEAVMDNNGNISIGRGQRSRLFDRGIEPSGLATAIGSLTPKLVLTDLASASVPVGVKQQREQETRTHIESVLNEKFVDPPPSGFRERYDFKWHGYRIQAKTATNMGTYWQFKLSTYTGSGIRKAAAYKNTDFDFLLVYLPGTHTDPTRVLFVPMQVLARYGMVVDEHGSTPGPCVVLNQCVVGRYAWLHSYMFILGDRTEDAMMDVAIGACI